MQEAHQQAQQNKPPSGSITGSGDCLGFKFFAPDDRMLIGFLPGNHSSYRFFIFGYS